MSVWKAAWRSCRGSTASAPTIEGLTLAELGEAVGVSQRVIASYEGDDAHPPGDMLADLARALTVPADELLGLRPLAERQSAKTARLLKRLRKVAALAPADQRPVLKLIEALHETRMPGRRE